MPTIWRGIKNLSIIVDKSYSSPYDDQFYQNFANLMNSQIDARKYFLKPYHQVCIEDCEIPWQTDVSFVLKKLNEVKSSINDEIYREITDKIKSLPLMFIKKSPPVSTRVFLPTISQNIYQRVITMNPEDSRPLNRFFSSVVVNSYNMMKIISMLHKKNVLLASKLNFVWCKGCKNISISKNNTCFFCNSPNKEIFPMFHFPQKILTEWINGGNKFLEAMIYHAVKKASPATEIYSTVEVVQNGRKPYTEIDVLIKKDKQKYCAILATINPTLQREKRSARILKGDCKFDVILVTTSSNANEMGKNTIQNFTKIKNDSSFPKSLITYLKSNNYIN